MRETRRRRERGDVRLLHATAVRRGGSGRGEGRCGTAAAAMHYTLRVLNETCGTDGRAKKDSIRAPRVYTRSYIYIRTVTVAVRHSHVIGRAEAAAVPRRYFILTGGCPPFSAARAATVPLAVAKRKAIIIHIGPGVGHWRSQRCARITRSISFRVPRARHVFFSRHPRSTLSLAHARSRSLSFSPAVFFLFLLFPLPPSRSRHVAYCLTATSGGGIVVDSDDLWKIRRLRRVGTNRKCLSAPAAAGQFPGRRRARAVGVPDIPNSSAAPACCPRHPPPPPPPSDTLGNYIFLR